MVSIKRNCLGALLGVMFTCLCTFNAKAQTAPKPLSMPQAIYPWTRAELLAPAALAVEIKAGNAPLIFNIGAVEDIKDARHIGPVSHAENLEKFKDELASLAKNTDVVIYCGCCPFTKCPNIRPAYNELKKSGFTNIKVLNLSTNLRTDWTAKGYPLASE